MTNLLLDLIEKPMEIEKKQSSIAISGKLNKYYYPENIIVQHIPKKEKVEKKVNRLGKGNSLDTLTTVDIQESEDE